MYVRVAGSEGLVRDGVHGVGVAKRQRTGTDTDKEKMAITHYQIMVWRIFQMSKIFDIRGIPLREP